jgi:hypothetical protein
VDQALDHPATAIIAIAAVVDPSEIVLDGSVGRAFEPHLDALRAQFSPRPTAASCG